MLPCTGPQLKSIFSSIRSPASSECKGMCFPNRSLERCMAVPVLEIGKGYLPEVLRRLKPECT